MIRVIEAEGPVRWIDVQAPSPEEMAGLAAQYPLHPLAVEDSLHRDQRPKLEEYPGHLFVVIHAFYCPEADPADIDWEEVHVFLLESTIITVHDGVVAPLEALWKRAETEPAYLTRGVDWVLYGICDVIVDETYPALDSLAGAIEELESDALEPRSREELGRVFRIKKALALMRRMISPARDVFLLLSRRTDGRITEKTALYFRDVYDHVTRLTEQMDTLRDFTSSVLELYLSSASHRTNEIVKRLTIMSAIFLPLGFIVGFFGQNFEHMPFASEWMFLLMIGLVATLPLFMIGWFISLGWIHPGRGARG